MVNGDFLIAQLNRSSFNASFEVICKHIDICGPNIQYQALTSVAAVKNEKKRAAITLARALYLDIYAGWSRSEWLLADRAAAPPPRCSLHSLKPTLPMQIEFG
jgi:hypothetical protein